jgi:chromosome partitioning protein
MAPFVLGFISQKGGVGKSTLARAAAVALSRDGYRVRLADLDPQQQTSAEWYKRRINNGGDALASVDTYETVRQALENGLDMRPALDVLVVDAPGRSSDATIALAQRAHLVIQPATGTLDDLKPGVLVFHELRKNQVPPARMLFALTRTGSDAEEERARAYIQASGYAVLDATLREQTGYKYAQDEGKSVLETPFPSLNERAEAVIKEIFIHLTKLYSTESQG